MSPAGPGGVSTDEGIRVHLDVTREVRHDYALLTGTAGRRAPAGLWVALARRAMGAVLDVPPGGVLLAVSCDPAAAPTASRVAFTVGHRTRATKDGRRVVTVSCDAEGEAAVTFVLLLPSDLRSSPPTEATEATQPPPAPRVAPLGEEPVSIGIEAARAWSRLTGDLNPLHTDEAYARRSSFGGPIVQGHYLAALAGDWTEHRSGTGTPWLCDFVSPIPVGASLRVAQEPGAAGPTDVVSCNGSTAVRLGTPISPEGGPP